MNILLDAFIITTIIIIITNSHTNGHASLGDKFSRFKIITPKHLRILTAKTADGNVLSKRMSLFIFGKTVTLKIRPDMNESILTPGARFHARHVNGTNTDILLDLQDFYQGIILGHPGSNVHSVKLGKLWLIHTNNPNNQRLSFSIEPLTFHLNLNVSINNKIRHQNKMVVFRHKDINISNKKEHNAHCQHYKRNKTKSHFVNNQSSQPKRKSFNSLYSKFIWSSLSTIYKDTRYKEIKSSLRSTGNGNNLSKSQLHQNLNVLTTKVFSRRVEDWNKIIRDNHKDFNRFDIRTRVRRKKQEKDMNGSPATNRRRRKRRNSRDLGCDILSIADYTFFSGVGQSSLVRTAKLLIYVFQMVGSIFWNTDFKVAGYDKKIGVKIRGMEIFTDSKLDEDISVYFDMRSRVERGMNIKDFVKNAYFRRYCLVHLSTQRALPHGIVDEAITSFHNKNEDQIYLGICGGTATMSTNVGLSTVTFQGEIVPIQVYYLIVAHELGHNFGAEHDNPKDNKCSPPKEKGGIFLMGSKASRGLSPNNNKFSPCSKRDIVKILKEREPCLLPMDSFDTNQCGNGIVDDGEDCDVGLQYQIQNVTCCTNACRFAPNADCSPFNHLCCNNNCTVAAKGMVCHSKQVHKLCSKPGMCDGVNPDTCLPNGSLPNGYRCGFEGECYNGICINFCQTQGEKMVPPMLLVPCDCDESSKEMCSVCCYQIQSRKNISLCKPIDVSYPDKTPCLLGYCKGGECQAKKNMYMSIAWNRDKIAKSNATLLVIIGASAAVIIVILVAYIIIALLCSNPR